MAVPIVVRPETIEYRLPGDKLTVVSIGPLGSCHELGQLVLHLVACGWDELTVREGSVED